MASRLIIFLFIVFTIDGFSQGLMEDKLLPTRQDTLRGSITPERKWWDLTYYHLDIKVEPDKKFISGSNTVGYKVLKSNKMMQIDLQEPMKITSVEADGKSLKFNRDGNAYFIELKQKQKKNDINYIKINYEGFPKEAIRAPWDGGLSWTKDENGNHFINLVNLDEFNQSRVAVVNGIEMDRTSRHYIFLLISMVFSLFLL